MAKDRLLVELADYAANYKVSSAEALRIAQYVLMDSIGTAMLALRFPECAKHIGPIVPGATLRGGARVPGTQLELDPVHAAFTIGALIRWLDYNDTWLAAEWGHPSDNLGSILAVADYVSRSRMAGGGEPLAMREVLEAAVKAHEIQGVLALNHSFNRVGLDHVLLVRIASAAVATALLGGSAREIEGALSNSWLDGGALRTYRHTPNTGSRKSWAAGDAASRAVRHALMAMNGEMGYDTPLTAENWGFQEVLFKGRKLELVRPLGTYVMENVLFKISFPAEFHAQTAVECAFALHDDVRLRLEEIETITLTTHESAIRIIDKTGPLHNPADRDHCLQYMVAVALIHGTLTAEHYEDEAAADPRIDALRAKMTVVHDEEYSRDYLDPDKRSIANAIQVRFADGTETEKAVCEYPIGHRRRREEGLPKVIEKCEANLLTRFPRGRAADIMRAGFEFEALSRMPVTQFMGMLVI